MKNIILYITIMALSVVFTNCEKDFVEPMSDIELKGAKLEKATGFDQWGYNWNAHQFNGYLINAWFGDEMYPYAPWYKRTPPFGGDIEGYQEMYPVVLEYPFWGYGDMKVIMHWNEACISREGVYPESILDSDAWITFHYSQGEGKNKWSQFQKFVAVKSSDELTVYQYDEAGNPAYGEWFSQEGESVGMYYLWEERALIQVVNAGNIPPYLLQSYKSPLCPGIGKFKNR